MRKDELIDLFFNIHSATSLPECLKDDLLAIHKEEAQKIKI